MTEPTPKTLLGPGPSNVHPRVYSAMSGPVLSHMDPDFWAIMDETVELLREVFQTGNGLTLPISGSGSAGMEAALYNSLEPGDTVVVGVAGFFASRIVEIAQRCEANVVPVEAEWGKAVSAAAVEEALAVIRRRRSWRWSTAKRPREYCSPWRRSGSWLGPTGPCSSSTA